MDEGPRYAIYFVPAAGSDLYRFDSSILGYDCYTGEAVTHPDDVTGDAASWCGITEEPRRYGFHATLKAPFHLSRDYTELQLATPCGTLQIWGTPSWVKSRIWIGGVIHISSRITGFK